MDMLLWISLPNIDRLSEFSDRQTLGSKFVIVVIKESTRLIPWNIDIWSLEVFCVPAGVADSQLASECTIK